MSAKRYNLDAMSWGALRSFAARFDLSKSVLDAFLRHFNKIDGPSGLGPSVDARMGGASDGRISRREFFAHFELEDTPFARRVFSVMDSDGGGEIDFGEFVMSLYAYCTQEWRGLVDFAFDLADSHKDGSLSMGELRSLVQVVYGGGDVDATVERVLLKIDGNSDGAISRAEFHEQSRRFPVLLFPAFQTQGALRSKVMGHAWWTKQCKRLHGQRTQRGGGGAAIALAEGESVASVVARCKEENHDAEELLDTAESEWRAEAAAVLAGTGAAAAAAAKDGQGVQDGVQDVRRYSEVMREQDEREAGGKHRRRKGTRQHQSSLKTQKRAKVAAAAALGGGSGSSGGGGGGGGVARPFVQPLQRGGTGPNAMKLADARTMSVRSLGRHLGEAAAGGGGGGGGSSGGGGGEAGGAVPSSHVWTAQVRPGVAARAGASARNLLLSPGVAARSLLGAVALVATTPQRMARKLGSKKKAKKMSKRLTAKEVEESRASGKRKMKQARPKIAAAVSFTSRGKPAHRAVLRSTALAEALPRGN